MLPIRKIILYNNGYASFERSTEVFQNSASLDLFFKSSDIDEVLKTLTLCDLDQPDSICNISYESTKADLNDAVIRIAEGSALTGLLQSLRGCKIKVLSDTAVEGVVIGVEELTLGENKREYQLALYTGGKTILSVNISHIKNIDLLEDDIQKDLQHSLDLHLSQKKKDLKKVTIFSKGNGKRRIQTRYALQMKEWTTSYRFTLDPANLSQFRLECWGIIFNNQEEDWESVSLTLVTGAPTLNKSNQSNNVASNNDGDIELSIRVSDKTSIIRAYKNGSVEDAKKKVAQKESIPYSEIRLIFAGKQLEDGRSLSDYNIANGSSLHVVRKTGVTSNVNQNSDYIFRIADTDSLSFHPIKKPITVKRNQSALVQVLDCKLSAQRVTLFNSQIRNGNPLAAILFENLTGYYLQGGSVVVLEGDKYLGEAKLENMTPKDEVLIPYAVELGCEVSVRQDVSKLPIHYVTAKNGDISFFNYRKQRTMYVVNNKSTKLFDSFFLDHVFLEGWELVETDQPVDVSDTYYRFKMIIEPKTRFVFNVREKTQDLNSVPLRSVVKDQLQEWSDKKLLDASAIKGITELLELSSQVKQISKDIYEREQEIRDCNNAQDRLRKNIDVLKVSATQQERYVKELSEEEDKLKLYQTEIKKLKDKRVGTEHDLDLKSLAISFEKKREIKKDETESSSSDWTVLGDSKIDDDYGVVKKKEKDTK